jgi:hypothetical protein
MKVKSPSPKKTDEEAKEELRNPDMAAFDKAMRALVKVPKRVVGKNDRKRKQH